MSLTMLASSAAITASMSASYIARTTRSYSSPDPLITAGVYSSCVVKRPSLGSQSHRGGGGTFTLATS